ncbi:transient receptor potential cation channel subfamily A member 1 [Clonorchis sinensis]|uniref:Transient receptor potential cation channel subfamily A member 1 n=1 Tax=Clonorchis sinensis TaxID=79923 RepID=G7YDT7_CLOSI|nr:transient receptor potential cation channel subfamily A member 1 [Clonorchis sinensis]
MTLLHHAMRSHNFYLARRLVSDYGADVSARSKSGITPLHLLCKTPQLKETNDSDEEEEDLEEWAKRAVEQTKLKKKDKRKSIGKKSGDRDGLADQDIISFLVKNGANVNATDYSGSTPLHYTALYNQPEYARGLIKNGAELECRDIEGMTPFILAVEKNHTAVAKVLLENGADYSAKDNNNNNVLHLCCLNKDHATLGLLSEYLSQVDVNVLRKLMVEVNRFDETPAHYAARREDPSLLQSMLPTTIDPEHIDTKGRNWLHIAAETMEPDIVNIMREYGIDINATDSEGNTPLTIAARFGNAAMANKLIQNGAKVNCPNNSGKTPLMIACQTENEHLVESLISNGAELSLLDNQQNSAFYYAIKTRNYKIVSKLLRGSKEKHKILGWKNRNGDTSLHIVASLGDEEMIVNLHNVGAYRWALNFCRQTPLHIAAAKGHLKVTTHLTEAHPSSIDAGDENGNTALHYAAKNGHLSVVEHLLKLEPPTHNSKNVQGRTALMFAAEHNQIECIGALLKARNLNVNMTDNFGRTPLMIACEQGNAQAVGLLLQSGAELNYCISQACKPFAGWNALNLAIWSRSLDCVLEILNRDNWHDAMWNTAKDLNGEWMTPMRQMIKELPKAALRVLDKCVEQYEEPDDPKSRVVKFDFRFLEQWESYMRSPWTQRPRFLRNCCKSRQKYTHDDITVPFLHSDQVCVLDNRSEPELVHPMRLMLKYNREELFSHPVVQSILSRMWQPVLGFYLLNMAFFLLFVSLFTSFMVLTDPPYLLLGQRSLSTAELCAEMEQNQQKAYRLFVQFPKYALMVTSIINILKEIAQLSASGRSYLTLENLVEWTIFVLAVVTTIDTSACMAKTGLREHWQWQTGTVGLTLAWVDMLFFMQRLFSSGNYVGTFVLISKNLLKLFAIFSPFWIAFMIGFHLLLANHYAFMDLGNSLTKMITMTSGEVDFSGTMMSHYDEGSGPEAAVYYASVTYALMLLFICIMTIGMQNMLTAIAVGDVNEMQGRAHFDRLRKTTETLLNLRGVMVFLRIWRPLPTVYTYSLDQPRGILFGWIYKAMGGTEEYEISEENEDEEEVSGSLSLLNELKITVSNLEEAALALHKTIIQGK